MKKEIEWEKRDWIRKQCEISILKIISFLTQLSKYFWCFIFSELDDAAMRAIASLLVGLPLQTEGLEADIVDAKSQLFLK